MRRRLPGRPCEIRYDGEKSVARTAVQRHPPRPRSSWTEGESRKPKWSVGNVRINADVSPQPFQSHPQHFNSSSIPSKVQTFTVPPNPFLLSRHSSSTPHTNSHSHVYRVIPISSGSDRERSI